jgi:hypothetical protein
MLYMPFGIASAFSSIIYAYVRDATGSYDAVLLVAMFGFVLGGGDAASARPLSRFI